MRPMMKRFRSGKPSPLWAETMNVSAKLDSLCSSLVRLSRTGGFTRSTLLITSVAAILRSPSPVTIVRNASSMPSAASTTSSTTSASARAAPRGVHHGAIEATTRREDPGQIDIDNLRRAFHGDAGDARARGLRLGRDDRHLGADETVDQGRFAGVGRADDGDIPAMLRAHRAEPFNESSRRNAAARSAARLEAPSPTSGACPSTETSMRKCG